MAASFPSSLGPGMRQAAGSSEKVVVKSNTLARSEEGAIDAAIKSTSYYNGNIIFINSF